MRFEKRSVVSTEIIDDGSITLVNPDGDLIIDAPIVSRAGNILFFAKNVFFTARAKVLTENQKKQAGDISVQSNENIISDGGMISAQGKARVETKGDFVQRPSYKTDLMKKVREFDIVSLRHR